MEKTIEQLINEQKAKIKEDNRELSRLQEELKKKNTPLIVAIEELRYTPPHIRSNSDDERYYDISVKSNKFCAKEIKNKILELNESNSIVKIDWSKIDKKYKWIAKDKNGMIYIFTEKPILFEDKHAGVWNNKSGSADILFDKTIEKYFENIPWKSSLIKRPE